MRRGAICAAGLLVALLLPAPAPAREAEPRRAPEPNTLVPAGAVRYAPSGFPDRIVATPAEDPSSGFAVAWRTGATVDTPWLEIVEAGDSPDMGAPRRIRATTRALTTENGAAHHHRADVAGLEADTLYAWRVQGGGTWSPWRQLRTAAAADAPLTLLYFGDTQNKNASLTTRVSLEALRHAPDARLALYAGDLVSGGDGEDDDEWGEWFDATAALRSLLMVAPAAGNHEHFEQFEDTPRERRVLGAHWPATFALPGNGAPGAEQTTWWFDFQDVRVVVLDGTSALDMGTARAQAAWLDGVLAGAASRWTIALIHQPMFSPRQDRDNALLREHLLPVLERRRVDLVLQGHDHVYGRRGGLRAGQATPQYVVSVAGAKQYRLSDAARDTMAPVAEDTQLFQVLRIDGDALHYEARTATGRLYDAFSLHRAAGGARRIEEHTGDRIGQRDCPRAATLKGRTDRCWE
ncbi:metallophosphoesterase family protein [Luteimonas sp. RD2P54]|uniref:Metallophosphoesterase family protein n=1 Tax=Luteimonas endophytica TaxID=3042023 RepID=A0ABT6JC07_9GAMM|nr:metallophosphoesterase family protein [Luteimonas endophytica]MDH5824299.1 metallophosphoesterase family protein [Luteimonas endophytica]